MRTKTRRFLHTAAVAGCALLASCVDKSYDLDDIDWTLGGNVDLRLPYCSTDSILLRNMMELEQEGVVQYVWSDELQDSFFCIRQKGKADVRPVNIGEIRIRKPHIGDIDAVIHRRDLIGHDAPRRISLRLGGETLDIDDREYFYDIEPDKAYFEIDEGTQSGDIDGDIADIERIGIRPNTATLKLHAEGLPDYVSCYYLNNITISVPRGIIIDECRFCGSRLEPERIAENQIRVSVGETRIPRDQQLELSIDVSSIVGGEDFRFDPASHTASISGRFAVEGSFGIRTSDFDTALIEAALEALSPEEIAQVINERNPGLLLPESIVLSGTAAMSEDIVVESLTGSLRHRIEDIEPIRLDDLPNFLNDDEVVLDLANPLIFLTAQSLIPATATTSLTLTNAEQDIHIRAHDILIKGDPAGTYANHYYLADEAARYLPQEYAGAQHIVTEGLGRLVRKIPKEIEVEVADIDVRVENLLTNHDYDIGVEYEVFAPIEFGKDFLLVYRDTERGWADDLGDLDKLDFGYLQLEALATSNLPAQASLRLIPIDREGREIPQLEVNRITVGANARDEKVSFTIRPREGYTVNDFLVGNPQKGVSQLDGVQFEARVSANGNEGLLRRNAALLFRRIQVSIKGGYSYDAN